MQLQGTIISRHLLRQVVMAVGLLTCVLLFIAWLTQSLRYLELIANNGISLLKFVKIIAFLLPTLIVIILPACCLIASASVLQKLLSENEAVIYQNMGLSPFQIAKPFLGVGIILTGLVLWTSNNIAPHSADKFTTLKNSIAKEFSAGLLRKGAFSKFNGLTVYIQDSEEDKLHNIFIYKTEPDGTRVSIFAQNGEVLTNDGQVFIELFNGCRQIYTDKIEDNKAFFFQQLLYDLEILQPTTPLITTESAFTLFQLLWPSADLPAMQRYKMMAEAHKRIIGSYLVFFFILHAAAFLLTAPYGRGGGNKMAFYSIATGILLQIIFYAMINMLGKSYIILGLLYFLLVGMTSLYIWALIKGRWVFAFINFFTKQNSLSQQQEG